jgi:hypothetical protein
MQALPPDAPLTHAPTEEQGVVYLFAALAGPTFGLRVEKVQRAFPDCLARDSRGWRVRIEFEFASRNFSDHAHEANKCDWIVCWQHNWPGVPAGLRVVELRKYFGLGWNVWFQPLGPDWQLPRRGEREEWSVPSRAGMDDLLLVYRTSPESQVRELFRVASDVRTVTAGWKKGKDWMADVERVATLRTPLTWRRMQQIRSLDGAGFLRGAMAGRPPASTYWPALYRELVRTNPNATKALRRYPPERLRGAV